MGFTHARSLEIPETADEITSGPRTDDARTDLFTVLSGHNHRLVLLEVFSRPIFACPPNNVTQVKHVQHNVKGEGKKIKEKKDTRRDFPLITLIVCWNNTPMSSRPVANRYKRGAPTLCSFAWALVLHADDGDEKVRVRHR